MKAMISKLNRKYIIFFLVFILNIFNVCSNEFSIFKEFTLKKSYRIFINFEHYNLFNKKKYLECLKNFGIPNNLDFNNIEDIITVRVGYFNSTYFIYDYKIISNNKTIKIEGKNSESWSQSSKGFKINKSENDKTIIVDFENENKGTIKIDNNKYYFIKVKDRNAFENDFINNVAKELNKLISKNYKINEKTNIKIINDKKLKYNGKEHLYKTYLIWDENNKKFYDNYYVFELENKSVLVLELKNRELHLIDKQVKKTYNSYIFK